MGSRSLLPVKARVQRHLKVVLAFRIYFVHGCFGKGSVAATLLYVTHGSHFLVPAQLLSSVGFVYGWGPGCPSAELPWYVPPVPKHKVTDHEGHVARCCCLGVGHPLPAQPLVPALISPKEQGGAGTGGSLSALEAWTWPAPYSVLEADFNLVANSCHGPGQGTDLLEG